MEDEVDLNPLSLLIFHTLHEKSTAGAWKNQENIMYTLLLTETIEKNFSLTNHKLPETARFDVKETFDTYLMKKGC